MLTHERQKSLTAICKVNSFSDSHELQCRIQVPDSAAEKPLEDLAIDKPAAEKVQGVPLNSVSAAK